MFHFKINNGKNKDVPPDTYINTILVVKYQYKESDREGFYGREYDIVWHGKS